MTTASHPSPPARWLAAISAAVLAMAVSASPVAAAAAAKASDGAIEAKGGKAIAIHADISKIEDVLLLYTEAQQKLDTTRAGSPDSGSSRTAV